MDAPDLSALGHEAPAARQCRAAPVAYETRSGVGNAGKPDACGGTTRLTGQQSRGNKAVASIHLAARQTD